MVTKKELKKIMRGFSAQIKKRSSMKNEKHPEYQYLNLLRDILDNGTDKPIFGVEGVNLRSVFGRQIRFDLSDGFPLLTTKKVFLRGVIEELLWFLRGDSNVKYFFGIEQDS